MKNLLYTRTAEPKVVMHILSLIHIYYKLPIVTPLGENSFRGKGGIPFDEACIFAKELEACGVDTLHAVSYTHLMYLLAA